MPEDFLIAVNPEEGTRLPFLVRIPLGPAGIVLKVKERWPRTAKVYCHPAQWPTEAEILERVPTRSCVRRGSAIDLVLERGRENRSQFVLTRARGREAIFWQSARTTRMARPNVALPTARAAGVDDMTILVDVHERYAWRFTHQQTATEKAPLAAGDYAVRVGDRVVAAVERKSLADLVGTMISGKMRYLLADLAALPHAAVVVEDRYSQVFALERVRPSVVAEGLAECAIVFPTVPVIFAENRALAQEWTFRFFGAALSAAAGETDTIGRLAALPAGREVPTLEPTTKEVRAWAREAGLDVPDRGRLRPEIWEAYHRATGR